MVMFKHNYPRSQHRGAVPPGSTFAPEPAVRTTNQSNNQQMLANVLRSQPSPQMSLTEEEIRIVEQLIQKGMNEQQAIQQVMSMKSG